MKNYTNELMSIIKEKVFDFDGGARCERVGTIISVKDGVAIVYGLFDARFSEIVEFCGNLSGVVLSMEGEVVSVVILGDDSGVCSGDVVRCTGRLADVPVGKSLLGRVVDSLGNPVDGRGGIDGSVRSMIEVKAPGVMDRKSVHEPMQTGIKVVDMLVPIGRGQRELIIGDRQTGKSALAVDAIINQKFRNSVVRDDEKVYCVYVAIGQKNSTVARVIEKFRAHGVLSYTTVVVASASDPAPLQYIAPYAGCAIAEFYRDRGMHCLIVYDDLSKHAVAYRQLSLLLRRPPGREAYPGDVFYIHSRLLERAAKMSDSRGAGSLTALPIIETQAGDVSAYIPTNVISITDGQIFLESELFNRGFRPAINVGLSVSRVGSAAQVKSVKRVAGSVKLALARYRELEDFAKFGSDLDPDSRRSLERGARIMELLKQPQSAPMSVSEQVVSMFIGVNGYLDDLSLGQVAQFIDSFLEHLRLHHVALMESLSTDINEDISCELSDLLRAFKLDFMAKLG